MGKRAALRAEQAKLEAERIIEEIRAHDAKRGRLVKGPVKVVDSWASHYGSALVVTK